MSRPCMKCRKLTGNTVQFEGPFAAVMAICEPCWRGHKSEVVAQRRRFQVLVDNGVTEAHANQIMATKVR